MPAKTSPSPNGRIRTEGINPPVEVKFVVKGEGLTDSVSTSYTLPGGNPVMKKLIQLASESLQIPGLARKNEGVQPKALSFNIEWRASRTRDGKYSTGWTIEDIQRSIASLQSLCFPLMGTVSGGIMAAMGRSFPVCRLTIANLYDLLVLVTQVSITWSNLWIMSKGLPMGADVNLGVEVFAYLTHTDVRKGKAFYSGGWPRAEAAPSPSEEYINVA